MPNDGDPGQRVPAAVGKLSSAWRDSQSAAPNFLLILTDQHCFHHLGCLHPDGPRTPNIDGLLKRGTAIDGMYTATPVCMPNRQSLLTMRMPSIHGGHSNGIPLDPLAYTFVDVLRLAGYDTALVGKAHLRPISDAAPVARKPQRARPQPIEAPVMRPDIGQRAASRDQGELSGRGSGYGYDDPYYGFRFVRLASRHRINAGGDYDRWLRQQGIDPERLVHQRLATSPLNPQVFCPALPAQLRATSYIAEQAKAFLRKHRRPDAPFFLCASFPDPHHPWNPPQPYYDMYSPADVRLPQSFFDSPRDQNVGLRRMHGNGGSKRSGSWPFFAAAPEAREIVAKTYGMISFIDDAVGDILRELGSLALDRHTVVIFCSDHGDYMGDHGLFLKGVLHTDSLVKVPFIWSDPQESLRRGVVNMQASFIDIGPSMLDRAGLEPFEGSQGQSFLPAMEQGTRFRDAVLIEQQQAVPWMGFPTGTRFRTLIDARYRISLSTDSQEGELYDRQADPHEYVNLWGDPAAGSVRAEMLAKLVREMAMMNETARWPTRRV